MKYLSEQIISQKHNKLDEVDIAHVLRAYASFQYVHYDCLELMLKLSIQRASDMQVTSLASIANSLSELSINNPVFFAITKEILMRKIDLKTPIQEVKLLANIQQVHPRECTMLMSAFCKA